MSYEAASVARRVPFSEYLYLFQINPIKIQEHILPSHITDGLIYELVELVLAPWYIRNGGKQYQVEGIKEACQALKARVVAALQQRKAWVCRWKHASAIEVKLAWCFIF